MLERFIPWKFLVRRILRSYGFPDPFHFLTRLYQFSQPSEIQTPVDLLRAGSVLHTRGLINTRAIQNNLDWVWPYWVERQFNPSDPSFIPRGYALTHVNLTHRDWTAVGRPDVALYPLVDPRGLVTPLYDGWSIDFWIYRTAEDILLPSRSSKVEQTLEFEPHYSVRTTTRVRGMSISTIIRLENGRRWPILVMEVSAISDRGAYLAACLRPYNPEGVQFIEDIKYDPKKLTWTVNNSAVVQLGDVPDKVLFSNYEHGDVIHRLAENRPDRKIDCMVGMATSSALFALKENQAREIRLHMSLDGAVKKHGGSNKKRPSDWPAALNGSALLQIPDPLMMFLYASAVRTLIILSASDIVPGPYTYRRFWFRDACIMINALLSLGLKELAFDLLSSFMPRQDRSGYFKSQDGEWDSNGEVLWIFDRYQRLTGEALPEKWTTAAVKGARWIKRKRMPKSADLHSGLLPAGFSAEHLGPNDFYYWDDFWGLAGLKAAARMAAEASRNYEEEELKAEAADFERTIFNSIELIPEWRRKGAIPASPYRRMDSGAIGSLAVDYPLQLVPADDAAVEATVNFLMSNCFYAGGFFQDMVHSGVNAYLTMDIAQTLMRRGDPRWQDLVEKVASLASSTGKWPEATHPMTGGGCMGDGEHGWAAAEWIQILRNSFVREEGTALIIGSGIFPRWMHAPEELRFGPTPTPHGDVAVKITKKNQVAVEVEGKWRRETPCVEIRIPGYKTVAVKRFADALPLEVLPPEELSVTKHKDMPS